MAREGLVELRQDEPFAPIYMRNREEGAVWERVGYEFRCVKREG